MKVILAWLLAAFCIAGGSAAHSQAIDRPLLLVAAPSLQGPYGQTALLVVPVDGKHVGFILNRATGLKLSALFPAHAASAKVTEPLYFGGPEMSESLFAVVRHDPGGQSLPLFAGLYVTGNPAAIERIIEQTPNDARFFAGFVGWQPGELAHEIGRGAWYVTEPDASLVFRGGAGDFWEELVTPLDGKRPTRRAPGLIETRLRR